MGCFFAAFPPNPLGLCHYLDRFLAIRVPEGLLTTDAIKWVRLELMYWHSFFLGNGDADYLGPYYGRFIDWFIRLINGIMCTFIKKILFNSLLVFICFMIIDIIVNLFLVYLSQKILIFHWLRWFWVVSNE